MERMILIKKKKKKNLKSLNLQSKDIVGWIGHQKNGILNGIGRKKETQINFL
jgi:hypothetical protein